MQSFGELRAQQQKVFSNAGAQLTKRRIAAGGLMDLTPKLNKLVLVEIDSQLMRVFEGDEERIQYQVSTSWRGAGCRNGSGCTPLGWHQVDEKIGENEPAGTVFRGRVACGQTTDLTSTDGGDVITSRILWLQGMQPGYNLGGGVDSRARYIYIHGTAQEHLIGKAVSIGCIRMRNDEVIALFDQLDTGDCVYISQTVLRS